VPFVFLFVSAAPVMAVGPVRDALMPVTVGLVAVVDPACHREAGSIAGRQGAWHALDAWTIGAGG
jgi:hypothetical protein